MATTVTSTVNIRTAAGAIWDVWTDLDDWRGWQPETVSATWLSGAAAWTPGSRFDLLRRSPYGFGPARRFVGKVQSAAKEQLLVWELEPTTAAWFGPTIVQSVRLNPTPGGTTVTLTITAHGLGPSLLGFIVKGPLQKQADELIAALKQKLLPIERRL